MTIIICLLVVTALAAGVLYESAKHAASREGATEATRIATSLHGRIAATVSRVEDLATTLGERWPSRKSAFSTLADSLLQAPAVGRITLIRYVPASERARYERSGGAIKTAVPQRDGAHDRSRARAGASEQAHTRSLRRGATAARASGYFVAVGVNRATLRASEVGIDIGGEPLRRRALLAAARLGRARATKPVAPLSDPTGRRRAIVLFAPIYEGGTTPARGARTHAALKGYVAVTFEFSIISNALELLIPHSERFAVTDGKVTVAGRGQPSQATHAIAEVAGVEWQVTVSDPPINLSIVYDVLLAGCAFTLLIGGLSVAAGRRERDALLAIQHGTVEREAAESAAVNAETRFRTAFAEAPIGMALLSLEGQMLQVNRALARITGHSEEQLLTMSFADLTYPEDRGYDELAAAWTTHGHDVEKRLLKASGEIALVSAHTTLIRDAEDLPSYLLAQVEDITARRRYEARLQHLADHDPLTGLLNRRAFERELSSALESCANPDGAVLVLDLDAFKEVNDTLGHAAGDELITRVAAALSKRLRGNDAIARLGGDEFAILLRDGGGAAIETVARSLLATVHEQRAARGPGGRERPVTASIGIAPLAQHASLSASEVLAKADLAMYDAKEAGRDRAETYGEGALTGVEPGGALDGARKARIEARLEWAERVRAALDDDNLTLDAQPVLDATSGRIVQFELLLRLRGDDGAVIAPGRFLPAAERYGLIREIDRWVVSAALKMLAEQARVRRFPTVEINLSGASLNDHGLVEHVSAELEGSQVHPSQLIFEVTETAAIGNINAARDCAERLGALGCRFALDDFGAGFGSFYYVKHLPFELIKIDGEFVRNCTTSEVDRLVIRAIVELVRGMGKQTIAEFVGDAATLEVVRALGVDYAQGFYLGRPAPLSSWLAYADGAASRPDADVHNEAAAPVALSAAVPH